MSALTIRVEGGLLSPDFLERIPEAAGQKPADFGLPPRYALVDEVAKVWSEVRSYWATFQYRLARERDESKTTVTREHWVLPLLEALGYQPAFRRRGARVDRRVYPISHRAGPGDAAPPLHIVGCDQELGNRPPGSGQLSPHALVQDYLNRTEHLWGIVTNGYILRLLRDSSYFTRPACVEFDLQQMLAGERLDEFLLFYRLAHRTRLPQGIDDAPQCLLERYHQEAIEQGGRIREGLRAALEQALQTLGNGFLQHPRNDALREKLGRGDLSARGLYQQLLYLVYRFLFLMVAEERNLLVGDAARSPVYRNYFSLSRLRALAQEPLSAPERFDDLYLGLQVLFAALGDERGAAHLGLPVLNGALFFVHDLDGCHLNNRDLLAAVRGLSTFVPADERVPRRINYAALDVEELGSVYESLLDYQPLVQEAAGGGLEFTFVAGTERKTTGSYYTRPELVHELIKSALEPVIAERLQAAGPDPEQRLQALLALRVCDPACGSGHFLLAAARRIGREVARVRTGEDEPAPESVREGVREAITHCIYGVDRNPLAVDLCKVALWIEGHSQGKPLTFLDHRIRCGDSLVGVLDLEVLVAGIPDEAYKPVSGDDKAIATALRKRNAGERAGQMELFAEQVPQPDLGRLAELWQLLGADPDTDMAAVRRKAAAYEKVRSSPAWETLHTACNLWTAAFFATLDKREGRHAPTTAAVHRALSKPRTVDGQVAGLARALAEEQPFFHWPLEFPDVFAAGGFDVVLCNPPWERIKLQEQEFFAARAPEIAGAPNKAARERLIKALPRTNPVLWQAFQQARHLAEALSMFLRASERFPLTARGDINTYAVFAELFTRAVNPRGRVGMLVPTGIATDDTNKFYFAALVEQGRLASLYDFENREAIFPGVHRSYKFSLITVRGAADPESAQAEFVFFATRPDHLRDERRRFTLAPADFARINPNTRTCPIFRTRQDAELTRKIYERVPVLINEATGENPWGISFLRMFDMSNDSHLFRTRGQMERAGFRQEGNRFAKGVELWLPLYEGKMIWHFDHRFGTYDGVQDRSSTHIPTPSAEQYAASRFVVLPWYWVSAKEVAGQVAGWERGWFLGFRDITNATNERTAIFSLLPQAGIGNKIPLWFLQVERSSLIAALLANMCSMILDYTARQKIGGTSMNFFYVKQFPVLPPSTYTSADLLFIVPRVMELVDTAWDINPFADDVWQEADVPLRAALEAQWQANAAATGGGHAGARPPGWALTSSPGGFAASPSPSPALRERGRGPGGRGEGFPYPPFKWDEARRAVLRAELDALYARLYGLSEEELRYILDPADVYGPDFPGETFRVLKEKEIKQHGEYRTRRLVLEAWGRMGRET